MPSDVCLYLRCILLYLSNIFFEKDDKRYLLNFQTNLSFK